MSRLRDSLDRFTAACLRGGCDHRRAFLTFLALSCAVVVFAWKGWIPLLAVAAVAALGFVVTRRVRRVRLQPAELRQAADRLVATKNRRRSGEEDCDIDTLVEEMLVDGRYALLLRKQIAGNLSQPQLQRALDALAEGMALLPEGEVLLGGPDQIELGFETDPDERAPGVTLRVERAYLDRYPVTNLQYKQFVDAGGYEQMAIWDTEIWPAVIDFVDRSGAPGPRSWTHGSFPQGLENHPVVGVSWYEAAAYARWVGKRLPTDAEWVKSASWPVALSPTSRLQRRYPWGESMDRRKALLWGTGPNHTVSVYEYAEGGSVGGVYQLIGNVWEWTSGTYHGPDGVSNRLILPVPLKSLRGGAFDTYFDTQATCQFQSGENPVGRKHNVGFRCAVSACDVSGRAAADRPGEPASNEFTALEEVTV